MPRVRVFLADLPGVVQTPAPIRTFLETALRRVAADRNVDAQIEVSWTSQNPQPEGFDLLCYVVRDRSDSIIGSAGGIGGPTTPPSGLAGWTRFQTGSSGLSASEIYYSELRGKPDGFGGRIVLHELMHNMSRAPDSEVHGAGAGVGGETVFADSQVTDTDSRFIARHLVSTQRTQWTGGFGAYNDPLRGL